MITITWYWRQAIVGWRRNSLLLILPTKSTALRYSSNMAPERRAKQVCVVTGGSGFLGQHIVHLLQTKCDDVREVRTFDVQPIKKFLEYEDNFSSRHIIGDVTNYTNIMQALDGVDVVYHVAGVVSYGTRPDTELMQKVNVSGTENVIHACIEMSVPRLIFCSTVDVVVGDKNIVDGTEDTAITPSHFLFPGYPQTKHEAEDLVCRANGSHLANGGRLYTVSLRPNVMYGEGDPFLIPSALQSAYSAGGWSVCVGNGKAIFQVSYAGNVAWAFLMANRTLLDNKLTNVEGQYFFVPDDTPATSIYTTLEPYLHDRGFKHMPVYIPYWLIHGLLSIRDLFLWLISPLVKINAQPPICSIKYINMTLTFKNDKARTYLGFRPLFNPEEALQRSRKYYKKIKLN
ncbi:beta-hydroxysteroid dehydrogenase Delta 5-- [Octopus vulgaris]|uniref:Beta-hydroxysteroid dehydrogenase Delta 5 n=3 Tax=Octopus vulgaris TaxID=6645 RepID=A0AA36BGA0_OCTVU|nr:beta-hydroxysteroid dehydrogenase Delta 5-- [Octopus vulgaris]